jgi:endogenous inhibitor of DNA gyrase (YacG/DUF329 family)
MPLDCPECGQEIDSGGDDDLYGDGDRYRCPACDADLIVDVDDSMEPFGASFRVIESDEDEDL